jgi:hypothetical protein
MNKKNESSKKENTKTQSMTDTKHKYWYHITYEECVLCGRSHTYRERMYTEKPDDYTKRTEFVQYACDEHF